VLLIVYKSNHTASYCCGISLGNRRKNRRQGKDQDERVKRDLIFKEFLQGQGLDHRISTYID